VKRSSRGVVAALGFGLALAGSASCKRENPNPGPPASASTLATATRPPAKAYSNPPEQEVGTLPAGVGLPLGTMTGMMPSGTTFAIGLVVHLMRGAALAVAYAWLFERVAHRGRWTPGALVAIPHIVLAELMMGAIPMMHPLMPNPVAPRGVFMSGLSPMGVGAVLMLHVIFGAIVGGVYGDVRNPGHIGLGTRASHA